MSTRPLDGVLIEPNSQTNNNWSVTPGYDSSDHREATTTNDPTIPKATPKESSSSSAIHPSDQDFAFIGSQFGVDGQWKYEPDTKSAQEDGLL
ncbi:unnamed protein product [Clonostachys rosea]|uniref:Uncharacterized protein n=1 Tax=Bionectria ochroleuca TaxID=29856 RepID=A0ABY6UPH8_BIOOC|nr:unnamed protein product [Clonostachys rosea]